jgi:hypothetical protein
MGSTYRRAKEVVAWVGEEDGHSNEVMNALARSDDSRLASPSLSELQEDVFVNLNAHIGDMSGSFKSFHLPSEQQCIVVEGRQAGLNLLLPCSP